MKVNFFPWIFFVLFIFLQELFSVSAWRIIPALGRTFYGIGSLYDGRSGNFLAPKYSLLSEKSRRWLPHSIVTRENTSRPFSLTVSQTSIHRPSDKLRMLFEFPEYNGLAIRGILGMLDLSTNKSAGFLREELTEEEMTEVHSDFFLYTRPLKIMEEEWKITKGTAMETDEQKTVEFMRMKREVRENFQNLEPKFRNKATHVVTGVSRGSRMTFGYKTPRNFWEEGLEAPLLPFFSLNQSDVTSVQLFTDLPFSSFSLSGSSSSFFNLTWEDAKIMFVNHTEEFVQKIRRDGFPLQYKLTPILEFFKEVGLQMAPSTYEKFQPLEKWVDPMDHYFAPCLNNLDDSWQLMKEMLRLEAIIPRCLKIHPKKDQEKGQDILDQVHALYEEFSRNLTEYEINVKGHLTSSSNGTEAGHQFWKSTYSKPDGIHPKFKDVLENAVRAFLSLGGKFEQSTHISVEKKGISSCDFIPESKQSKIIE